MMTDLDETTADPPAPRPPRKSFLREVPVLLLTALVMSLLIRSVLVQAFWIPSASMEQTLVLNDRVLVNKVVHRFRDIERGEVVVFHGVNSFTPDPGMLSSEPAHPVREALQRAASILGLAPSPGDEDFIKRVIGLPGDRVSCCTDGKVTVQPRGSQQVITIEEPYLYEDDERVFCAKGLDEQACPARAPGVLVPEGRLFVMGDHRSQSSDSRAHLSDGNNGTVPIDQVVGRAFAIVWPFSRAGGLEIRSSIPD